MSKEDRRNGSNYLMLLCSRLEMIIMMELLSHIIIIISTVDRKYKLLNLD